MARQETLLELPFPFGGIDVSRSFHNQPQENRREGQPATAVDLLNVRGYDPRTGRQRGARRAGLTRFLDAQHSGANRIQDINAIVVTSTETAGAGDLLNRDVTGVAVSNGNVKKFSRDGSYAFPAEGGGSGALSATAPRVFSTVHFCNLYFADGVSQKYYDADDDEVKAWTAAEGAFPANGAHRPQLIETWRSRIVMSGLRGDRQNWFMSAVDDAFDWDYGPAVTLSTQAVAGNNAPRTGLCPDVVNCIIPYSDDLMIFGCDRSLWMLTGDPMFGGQFTLISDVTGMAFGRPWCREPAGVIFFFGSRGGVFALEPGGTFVRISRQIEEELENVDLGTTSVRMAWNDREQGIHLLLTPLTAGPAVHWYYDTRNRSWWKDQFPNAMNPVAVHVFDGDDPDDRVILLGGEDGRIRFWDREADDDDGEDVPSECWLGPVQVRDFAKLRLEELQATLALDSEGLDYAVHAAGSAEAAFAAPAAFSGTWTAGRNYAVRRRAVGNALYVKLHAAAAPWALESLYGRFRQLGPQFSRMP